MKKRLLSILLTLCMFLSLMPAMSITASAAEDPSLLINLGAFDTLPDLSGGTTTQTVQDGGKDYVIELTTNSYFYQAFHSQCTEATIGFKDGAAKITRIEIYLNNNGIEDFLYYNSDWGDGGNGVYKNLANPSTSVTFNPCAVPSSTNQIKISYEADTAYAITNGTPAENAEANNGSIAIDKTTATAGATVTVTVTPAEGYELDKLKYNDGTSDTTIQAAEGVYTFAMPAKAVTVTATFKQAEVTYDYTLILKDGKAFKNSVADGNEITSDVAAMGLTYANGAWTMNNFVFNTTADQAVEFKGAANAENTEGINIKVTGVNTITGGYSNTGTSYGIWFSGYAKVTISGTGDGSVLNAASGDVERQTCPKGCMTDVGSSLTFKNVTANFTAGKSKDDNSFGVAILGALTVDDGAKVTCVSSECANLSRGIQVGSNGSITVKGTGEIYATSAKSNSGSGAVVYSKNSTNGEPDACAVATGTTTELTWDATDKTYKNGDNIATSVTLTAKKNAVCYIDADSDGSFTEGTDKKYATLEAALADAKSGDTVTLLADVDWTETYAVGESTEVAVSDIVIDLNGKTLKLNACSVDFVADKLEIKNGTLDFAGVEGVGYGYEICSVKAFTLTEVKSNASLTFKAIDGTALLKDCEFTNSVDSMYICSGVVTVEGGTYVATEDCNGLFECSAGYVVIKGGTFSANEGSLIYGPKKDESSVYGGTFSEGVSDYCAEGCVCVDNGDGTFSAGEPVAKIGDINYLSLEAALSAVSGMEGNQTIELLKETTEYPDHEVRIDLKGDVTLTASEPLKATIAPTAISEDAYGMFCIISSDGNNHTFTLDTNVTLVLPAATKATETTPATVADAMYIGFNLNEKSTLVVNGRLEAYEPYVSVGSTMTVNPSGSVKSINECLIVRRYATVTVDGTDGGWTADNPQIDLSYASHQGGIITFKSTFVDANAWWQTYNRNGIADSETKLVLDNTVLTAGAFKSTTHSTGTSDAFTVELKNGSGMTFSGEFNNIADGTIKLDAASKITAGKVTNAGTISIDTTGATEDCWIAIDSSDSTSSFGTVSVTDTAGKYKAKALGADLYVAPNAISQLYVNGDWAGIAAGTVIEEGKIFGLNAFAALADAAKEAPAGASTITVSGDATLSSSTAFGGGQDVTITGNATVGWDAWFMIGRDASQGDVTKLAKVTFSAATITKGTGGSGDTAFHISGAEDGSATKGYGQLDIVNGSNIYTTWTINKNVLNVTDSTFTSEQWLNIAGRPASETASGEDYEAVLNINNSTVNAKGSSNSSGLTIGNEGKGLVTMTKGTLNAASITATDKSSIVMNGGENKIAVDGAFANNGTITMKFSDAITANAFNNDNGTITVDMQGATTASYKIVDASEASYYGDVRLSNAGDYVVKVLANDLYAVKGTVKIVRGETTTYFATLDDAIASAKSGDTVTLLADADMSERAYEDTLNLNGITLDLNGKTWKTGEFAVAGSNYEIKNGTVAPSEDVFINMLYLNVLDEPVAAENIKLTNLTINGGVVISNAQNVAVSNCSITADSKEEVFYVDSGSTVTIDGGTYTLINDASYIRLLNSQDTAVITVKSGTFSASTEGCMYCISSENSNYGTVIANGGTFNQDVSEICAEHYYCKKVSEGVYTVQIKETLELTLSCKDISSIGTPSPVLTGAPDGADVSYSYSYEGGEWTDEYVYSGIGTYAVKAVVAEGDSYLEASADTTFQVYYACSTVKTVDIQEGTFTLILGGNTVGEVTLEKSSSGWLIKNPDTGLYLRYDGNNVSWSTQSYPWSYDGGFYFTKTTTSGWWIFARTVRTNYYLTYSEGRGFPVTSAYTPAVFTVSVNNEAHGATKCVDNGDGTHTWYCTVCGENLGTASCEYGDNHVCPDCGHYDPSCAQVNVVIDLYKSYNSNGWIRFWYGKYTYYAVSNVECSGDTVARTEYSLNGSDWYTGSSYSSYSEFSTFYIRVTTAGGQVSVWQYVNGRTVQIG